MKPQEALDFIRGYLYPLNGQMKTQFDATIETGIQAEIPGQPKQIAIELSGSDHGEIVYGLVMLQAKAEKIKRIDEHMQQRAMEMEAQDKLAQVGQRIEGSSLVRDFCVECGNAMRVVDAGRPNTCLDCKPTGCPGVCHGTVTKGDIEYHGGKFHSAEW